MSNFPMPPGVSMPQFAAVPQQQQQQQQQPAATVYQQPVYPQQQQYQQPVYPQQQQYQQPAYTQQHQPQQTTMMGSVQQQLAAAAAPVMATALPGYAAQPPPGGAGGPVTSNDRWAVLWTVLKLYYCLDASLAFFLALGGLVFSLATFKDPSCTVPFLGISILIFITRLFDFGYNVREMCCCPCCPPRVETHMPPPQQHHQAWPNDKMGYTIRFNFCICCTQLGLSTIQGGLGIVGVLGGFGKCEGAGPVLALVFGAMLFMNAAEEAFIWGWAWFLHKEQHNMPLPGWVDSCIPDCVWAYARRTSR